MRAIEEIHKAHEDVLAKMMEKGFVTPECVFSIRKREGYDVTLWVHNSKGPRISDRASCDYLNSFYGKTPQEAFQSALDHIASQPDPETEALHRYMRKLGAVVDEGRADGIPDEYTAPVSLTIKAMSDNLLAAPEKP